MPSSDFEPNTGSSCRSMSGEDRDLSADGYGVREIARYLGRSMSRISRSCGRYAAAWDDTLIYHALTAYHWADLQVRR